jgi:cytochrome c-type biogenesis protein CcmF
MEDIQYIGEHLLPGKIGHLAILLGFVSALLASLAYYMAVRKRDTADYNGWRLIGRTSFSLHGLSVLTVIGVIFYVMVNKYYEYNYVFAHVNEDLPFQYIFLPFGKVRKEVSCCGCSGMSCWAAY